jgi:hypothetical protein
MNSSPPSRERSSSRIPRARSYEAKQLIANTVTQRVVDAFKVVQINTQQAELPLLSLGDLESMCEAMTKMLAIGQARQ